MRRDVSSLLEKLGRRDFRYEAFADPISDLEPWPLLAALLEDPRVVGEPQRAAEWQPPQPQAASSPFLSRYAPGDPAPAPEAPASGNLRSFLSGLSDDRSRNR